MTTYFYLVPGITALMAYALFGEWPGWIAVAGMAVALVGVALAAWSAHRSGLNCPIRSDLPGQRSATAAAAPPDDQRTWGPPRCRLPVDRYLAFPLTSMSRSAAAARLSVLVPLGGRGSHGLT
ncbi:hypothetical protein GCM10009608_09900 [Pseudonocardia alaniniphila]